MKKLYISPATDVYKFSIDGILLTASQDVGDSTYAPGGDSKFDTGGEGGVLPDPGEGGVGDVDYSRDNNRGSVWDNIW